MDDELNILPTSSRVKDIKPIERNEDGTPVLPASATNAELKELVATLQDTMVRCPMLPSPRLLKVCEGRARD